MAISSHELRTFGHPCNAEGSPLSAPCNFGFGMRIIRIIGISASALDIEVLNDSNTKSKRHPMRTEVDEHQ